MGQEYNCKEGDESVTQIIDPRDLFREMIDKLEFELRVYVVILFGSRATGRSHPDSDYDLVVIADFKTGRFDRPKIILRIKPRVPIDIFCFTPEEFEKSFGDFDLTAIDAIGEGIVLYGEEFVKSYKEKYAKLVQAGMRKKKSVLILPSVSLEG